MIRNLQRRNMTEKEFQDNLDFVWNDLSNSIDTIIDGISGLIQENKNVETKNVETKKENK